MSEVESAYLKGRDGDLCVANDFIEVRFLADADYGICSAENVTAANSLCRAAESPTLFLIAAIKEGTEKEFTNADAQRCSHSVEECGGTVTLTIRFDAIGGMDLRVVVTATLAGGEPEVAFRIKVRNDEPDLIIRMVGFPWFTGYRGLGEDAAQDRLVLPHREGVLLDDPLGRAMQERLDPQEFCYPGHVSMQCMALYDAVGGFLIWSDDTQGNIKRFACDRRSESDDFLTVGVEHHVPDVPGRDFCPDYSVRLTAFQGDWYNTAEIYRDWATKQWWCREKLHERKDIPQWYRGPWPVFSIENYATTGGTSPEYLRHALAEIPDQVESYSGAVGMPLISFWTGWERYGAWVSPDLFPPIEGEEALRSAIEITRSKGHRIMIYFSQALWIRVGEEAERHFQEQGELSGIMQRGGKRHSGEVWFGKHTQMCPATEVWQRIVRDTVLECLARGIDVVQLDMFPILAPKPCCDPAHGHPLGVGRWFHDATMNLLRRTRMDGKAFNSDLVMSAEHMCELYIPFFDTFTSRDERRNLQTPWPRKEITEIPMFLFVYHEYLYTQALEWNMIYLDHFCRDIALQLARGKRLSFFEGYGSQDPEWKSPSEAELQANKKRGLEFLARAGKLMRTEAGEFILTGKMLRPPPSFVLADDGGRTRIDWNTTEPALGMFSLPDGRVLIVVANAGDSPRDVVLELKQDVCNSSLVLAREIGTEHKRELSLPCEMKVSVPPLDVRAVMVSPVGSGGGR